MGLIWFCLRWVGLGWVGGIQEASFSNWGSIFVSGWALGSLSLLLYLIGRRLLQREWRSLIRAGCNGFGRLSVGDLVRPILKVAREARVYTT